MSSNEDTLNLDVKSFSDQDLREKLIGLGMDVGPITGTTRNLYERKLIQLLTGSLPESQSDPPPSPPSPPRTKAEQRKVSPQKSSPVVERKNLEIFTDGSQQPSAESTINLIRARKPVARVPVAQAANEPLSRRSVPSLSTPSSPYPAANAQFRRTESAGSSMDHILKFVLFAIVMLVVVYFISSKEPGNSLDHRS